MKDRQDEAVKALQRLRPKSHIENGWDLAEVDALSAAIEQSRTSQQGRWVDLLHGDWPKRVFVSQLPQSPLNCRSGHGRSSTTRLEATN